MAEIIQAANGLTWPGAIAVASIVFVVGWVLVTIYKD